MSTYWGYRCTKCEEQSELEYNRGQGILEELYKITKVLYENNIALSYCQIVVFGASVWELTRFILDHVEHNMVLISEYEDIEIIKEE